MRFGRLRKGGWAAAYSTGIRHKREVAAPVCDAIALDKTLPTFLPARNAGTGFAGRMAMIYLLAVFLPPLGLLLNGQPISAIVNIVLIVPCFLFGLVFPLLFLVPSAHAVVAVYMKREDRKHQEIVEAIREHGPPPGWRG
jgi:hypothetical protein